MTPLKTEESTSVQTQLICRVERQQGERERCLILFHLSFKASVACLHEQLDYSSIKMKSLNARGRSADKHTKLGGSSRGESTNLMIPVQLHNLDRTEFFSFVYIESDRIPVNGLIDGPTA